jgi:hypothetical protein
VKPGDAEVPQFRQRLHGFCAGQPVDAAFDQKMRPEFLGQTEQLADVALAAADMKAAFGAPNSTIDWRMFSVSDAPVPLVSRLDGSRQRRVGYPRERVARRRLLGWRCASVAR